MASKTRDLVAEQLKQIEKGNPDVMNDLGIYYDKKGNFEEAEKYYLQAVEHGSAKAANNLGILYANSGKLQKAEKYLIKAISENTPKPY